MRTPGLVFASSRGREGSRMVVEYVANGAVRYGTIDYSNSEEYERGDRVEVIYDRSEPSRIRTPTDSNETGLWHQLLIYALIASLIAVLAAASTITRPRRWRRMLSEPWRPFQSTYIPGRRRRSGPGLALVPVVEPHAPPVNVRLSATLPQRAALLGGKRVVWVVGNPTSRVLVALPATRALYCAKAPRGFIGHMWQAEQKPPTRRSLMARSVYLGLLGLIAGGACLAAVGRHAWLIAALLATKSVVLLIAAARRRNTR